MKLSAPQSSKFLKLKRRLSLPHWQCVGLLESMWLFTQHNAPLGDIGRHSDEDLAASIEWAGDPTALITALIECGFIDECDENRLVVHDWIDHAPTYLKGAIAKHGKEFCRVVRKSAKQGAKQGARVGQRKTTPPPQHPAPNHTKPSLTEPSQEIIPPAVAGPSDTTQKPIEQKPAKTRERNPLFDAVAEVCGLDASTAGGLIASVVKALSSADPPYTPDDVRQFGERMYEFCSWAARDTPPRLRPTPKEVERYIGGIRAKSPVMKQPATLAKNAPETPIERMKRLQAELDANKGAGHG